MRSYKGIETWTLTNYAVAVGGTAGFLRTRSTPSLVAGLVLGASYGYSGALLPGQILSKVFF